MRVACAQYAVRDGDPGANRESSVAAILAAAKGTPAADLVVLPELANTGCDLSREDTPNLAEETGRDPCPTLQAWREAAEETGVFVVGGLLEREGETLYNSAVLMGPGGYFGRYRKTHLWDGEKLLYEPGRELTVFETPLGNIGLLVCYDAWFPEAARTLALKGVDLLCVPANAPDDWVPQEQRRGDLTMLNVHAVSHANANRLYVAVANRVGGGYLGRSCIADTTGGILAFGSATKEEIVHADIDLERARREKRLTNLSHAFGDRNTGVYRGELQS